MTYIGPIRAAYPTWRPAAGNAAQIGYAQGAHPTSGLAATLYDARPAIQSWNPGTDPWQTSNSYQFSSISAYCGGVWIDSLRKWAAIGAGHAAYNVPGLYAYDLETLAWEWLDTPLPTDGMSAAGTLGGTVSADRAAAAAGYTSGQFDAAGEWWWDGSSSAWGAYAQPGKYYPEPSHTYYGMVWVPGASVGNVNGIVLKCAPSSGRMPECVVPTRHYWDCDSRTWKLTANFRSNPSAAAGGSIYFGGAIDRVFSCTNTSGGSFPSVLDVFNPATLTWSTTTISGFSLILQIYGGGCIAHIPTSLLIFCCPSTSQVGSITYVNANQHQFWACDAAAAKAGTAVTFAKLTISNAGGTWPVRPTYGSGECGQVTWTYCPRNGCFYAINGNHNSTTLWKLAPPVGATTAAAGLAGTWTITTETLSTAIPCGSPSGASGSTVQSGGTGTLDPMNRLVWDETAGCLLWFDAWYQSRPVAIRPTGI